ncbi:hypothetical protein GGR07_000086 [Bacteroides pyogenes]|nr:hypothetical protein [Bacteroides pyogenes]SUV33729.1 Uncharacterised protein [Bacteroides pyogenes]
MKSPNSVPMKGNARNGTEMANNNRFQPILGVFV